MPRPGKIFEIVRRDQIQALSSPVRLEIVDAVRVMGPCSIADVADLVGRTPPSLYYHVEKLVEVGLLLAAGSRKGKRREEALYETPARRIRMPHDLDDPELTEERLKAFSALLRIADREHRAAFESGRVRVSGRRQNIFNGRVKGWLHPEDVRDVREHITSIMEIFERASGAPTEGSELHAITMFLTPIAPRGGSDKAS